jgi:hypothetical protein
MCKTSEIPKGNVECETCNGNGEAMFSCCTGEVVTNDYGLCPECCEHLGDEECPDCEGKGYVPETENTEK